MPHPLTLTRFIRQRQPAHGARIISSLLPALCISDATRNNMLDVIAHLPPGSALLIRDYHHPRRAAYAETLAKACRLRHIPVIVAGDARLAHHIKADGIHLPERRHHQLPYLRHQYPHLIITAAAHDVPTLHKLARQGADAALLSPVFSTLTHPEARPMGLLRFRRASATSPLPLYALGGITPAAVQQIGGCNTIKISAIGLFSPHSYPVNKPLENVKRP